MRKYSSEPCTEPFVGPNDGFALPPSLPASVIGSSPYIRFGFRPVSDAHTAHDEPTSAAAATASTAVTAPSTSTASTPSTASTAYTASPASTACVDARVLTRTVSGYPSERPSRLLSSLWVGGITSSGVRATGPAFLALPRAADETPPLSPWPVPATPPSSLAEAKGNYLPPPPSLFATVFEHVALPPSPSDRPSSELRALSLPVQPAAPTLTTNPDACSAFPHVLLSIP